MNMSPFGAVVAGDRAGRSACRRSAPALVRRVVDEVAAVAAVAVVAPDVAQVEPVADLVGGGAAEVERRGRRAGGAERAVEDDDAVGRRRAAGELRVAEQLESAAPSAAHPDVEISIRRPRRRRRPLPRISPGRRRRNRLGGLRSGDAVGARRRSDPWSPA